MNPQQPASQTPIAIVGMACLFPKADGLGAYWGNIRHGVDGITEVPASHWDLADYYDADPKKPDHTYGKRGGFLSPVDFNPAEFGMAPNALEATDTSQLLGLVVAQEALKNAGYGPDSAKAFDRNRVSVVLGVTGALPLLVELGARLGHPIWRKALDDAGIQGELADQIVERIGEGYVPWQEASFPGLLGNVVAGRIANRLDLGGTNCVVDAACASSLSAAHLATLELETGRSDMVVTGGVDTFNDIFMYMCFSKTPALSASGDARPFDAQGDGTMLGEGLGMVVLKRLEDAERDGDTVYAVLKGLGSSSDGRGKAVYAPSSDGQREALKNAYAVAGLSPETIELVEAHGTGTKVGDAVEVTALAEVYRAAKPDGQWAALGSVKSQIGHTKAAAGAAGLIKAALALHHKVLPATRKVREPLAVIADSPFYVNAEPRPWLSRPGHPRRAGVSALGFGGTNFHAVLEEYAPSKPGIDWDGWVELVTLSAETPAALETALGRFKASMGWNELRLAAFDARETFSAAHPHRLAFVVEKDATDLAALLASIAAQLKTGKAHWATPDGAFYGSGPVSGDLGVLFPGQGAQYVGMGRDLFCQFPAMLEVLTEADRAFAQGEELPFGDRLSDRLFPPSAFSPDAKAAQDAALKATHVAQPAIGAMSLGAYRVLEGFGFAPTHAAGHSYGELTALCVAHRLSPEHFHALSGLRGRLMGSGTGDRGSMLAVQAPLEAVEALVRDEKLDVVLANKNAPAQGVLSGATTAIDAAEAACKRAGLKAVRLPVAAAFHSALVADAARPFREALDAVTFGAPTMNVYANTTGARYPEAEAEARDMLGHQLAKPVEFVAQIEAMHAAGVRTFVEVGPGARLSGLVKQILGDRPHHAVALDASNGRRNGTADLARTLAQLVALGHPLTLTAWEGGAEAAARLKAATKKPAMAIPISGVNHRAKAPATGPLPAALKPAAPAAATVAHAPAAATNGHRNGNGNGHHANGNGNGHVAAALNGHTNGNGNGHAPTAVASVAKAPVAAPVPAPVAAAAPSPLFAEALRATQESMAALQRMQEQTAQLHRQFLAGQESTQQAFRSLVAQQQQVIHQALGGGAIAPVAHVAPVAPVAAAPVAYTPAPAPAPAPAPVRPMAAPAPVAPVAPAPKAPVAVAVAAPATPAVEGVLLAVVADKTGYPVEMLNLDMDMESDLGIDSIKRVEILSALQEKLPEAPVIKPEHLGTLRTLRQIIGFLSEGMPAATAAPVAAPAAAPMGGGDRVEPVLLGVVAEKTGYPVEMLNLDMDMESDLGIDSIKRVEILSALQEQLPEAPVIKPEHLGTLRTLRQIIGFLAEGMPASAPAPAAAPVAAANTDRVRDVLLTVVADKTGYPVEMLNLDMDMESDLGIDSIKRVEILSALQEQLPEAPAITPEHLGSLRTLAQMIAFLGAGAPVAAAPAAAPSVGVAPNRVETVLISVVADKTGYPAEMLNLDMDMESDLGIDSIKRVEILSALQEQLPEAPAITPEHLGSLRTLRQMIVHLAGEPAPAAPAAAPVAAQRVPQAASAPEAGIESLSRQVLTLEELSASRPALTLPVGAELWVADEQTALGAALRQRLEAAGYRVKAVSPSADQWPDASSVSGLVIVAGERETAGLWAEEQTLFLKRAFRLAQHVRSGLQAQGRAGGALFATVSRLDGGFGLRGKGGGDATTGGLAGLAKTAGHEWPEVACKAIDLAASWGNAAAAARAVADELFLAGPTEVGLNADRRVTLSLVETPLAETGPAPLAPGDVVVVSGGARGVTAEAAIALGRRFQPTLVLLGRSPLPPAEPAFLAGLATEGEIKSALAKQPDGPRTPKALQEAYTRLEADREVRHNLARLEATGAKVAYRSVDVRDEAAVAAVLAEFGPVRGLVHGAGVLADKLIADKTPEQFDQVFDTKVQGLRALLKAVDGADLKALVLFSSVTGRQGRKGQVDYAIANEVLNKVAHQQAAARPGCRVVAVNWGPWDGGMVTPALKRLFAEEGVGVVGLTAGAEYLAEELCQGPAAPVEVLVMGRVEGAPAPAPKAPDAAKPKRKASVAFTRELDVARYPFLASHVINGKAVLPAAMMVEWMAHGALHANPGMVFNGLEGFRVFKGVILGDAPATVRVTTANAGRENGQTRVEVELRGDADVLHASATVLLGTQGLARPDHPIARPAVKPYDLGVAEAYRDVLFHGADFQGIASVVGCSEAGIVATVEAAPDPRAWIAQPLRDAWLADPLALDAAFQLMILWSVANENAPCLPCFAGSYRQYQPAFPAAGTTVVATVRDRRGNQLVTDFAFLDADGRLVAELLGAEATVDASLAPAFRKNALAAV